STCLSPTTQPKPAAGKKTAGPRTRRLRLPNRQLTVLLPLGLSNHIAPVRAELHGHPPLAKRGANLPLSWGVVQDPEFEFVGLVLRRIATELEPDHHQPDHFGHSIGKQLLYPA